ncbi:hypothetical protein BX600DRAFT_148581 [Xylariales sp. PMI_506]|nr:hypothetical protein BX600DRAFT_148581 [Xylariales sp. PMI_506]
MPVVINLFPPTSALWVQEESERDEGERSQETNKDKNKRDKLSRVSCSVWWSSATVCFGGCARVWAAAKARYTVHEVAVSYVPISGIIRIRSLLLPPKLEEPNPVTLLCCERTVRLQWGGKKKWLEPMITLRRHHRSLLVSFHAPTNRGWQRLPFPADQDRIPAETQNPQRSTPGCHPDSPGPLGGNRRCY